MPATRRGRTGMPQCPRASGVASKLCSYRRGRPCPASAPAPSPAPRQSLPASRPQRFPPRPRLPPPPAASLSASTPPPKTPATRLFASILTPALPAARLWALRAGLPTPTAGLFSPGFIGSKPDREAFRLASEPPQPRPPGVSPCAPGSALRPRSPSPCTREAPHLERKPLCLTADVRMPRPQAFRLAPDAREPWPSLFLPCGPVRPHPRPWGSRHRRPGLAERPLQDRPRSGLGDRTLR